MATTVRRRLVATTYPKRDYASKDDRSPRIDEAASFARRPRQRRTPLCQVAILFCLWVLVRRIFFSSHPHKRRLSSLEPKLKELLQTSGTKVQGNYHVFVSISDGKKTAVHMGQSPESAYEAFQNAVNTHNNQQDQQTTEKQQTFWFKVDVVDRVESIQDCDFSQGINQQTTGPKWFYGIALDWNTGWAFLPEEVWANNMVDSLTNVLRWDNTIAYILEKHGSQQKNAIGWKPLLDNRDIETTKMKQNVDLFLTTSYWVDLSPKSSASQEQKKTIEPIYHGHPLISRDEVSPILLMSAAVSAGDYLIRSIKSHGRMVYIYNPRTDRESDGYNLTRHAGTLYAMARLLQHTRDPLLQEKIRLALNWLLQEHLMECQLPYPKDKNDLTRRCIVEDSPNGKMGNVKVAKLGVNALTLLAISEYVAAIHTLGRDTEELKYYMEVASDIVEYIQSAQNPDGSFVQKIQYHPGRLALDNNFFVRYYQGEAAFALARYYCVCGLVVLVQKQEWLQVAEAAALYIVDANWDVSDEGFVDDHWLMYGLAELHRCGHRLDPKLVHFAMRTVRLVAASQHTEDRANGNQRDLRDYVGTFHGSPSSASTATKSEGLCAVYDIAVDYQQQEIIGVIVSTVTDSVRYQLKTQFGPGLAMYMPQDPSRVLGGFRKGLDSLQLRNDYTQHNLSSFLCLAEVLGKSGSQLLSAMAIRRRF